jgi:lysophospholipase L1-like esterase
MRGWGLVWVLAMGLAACGAEDASGDPSGETEDTTPTIPLEEGLTTYLPVGYVAAAPARLIYLGDSITDGSGASNGNLQYTALLQDNAPKWSGFDEVDLSSTYPDGLDVIDVARGGATTSTMYSQQLSALENQLSFPASGETIVVFTIGGNDLQAALNPLANAAQIVNDTIDNMRDIIDWFQDPSRFPDGVFIYATNVYEPSDGTGQADECFFGYDFESRMPELERYNEEFGAMGEELGFAAIDLRGQFLGHGWNFDEDGIDAYDTEDPSRWMEDDCIHPNDRGHHEVRRLFHAAITGQPLQHVLPE